MKVCSEVVSAPRFQISTEVSLVGSGRPSNESKAWNCMLSRLCLRASVKAMRKVRQRWQPIFVIVAVHAVVGEEIEGPAEEQRLLGLPVGLIVGDLLVAAPGLQIVAVGERDPRLVELPSMGAGG